MLIIPAIDILNNSVVRLEKGDYNNVSLYNQSPLEQAKIYDELNFERIHIVDLEGSKKGNFNALKILADIKKETKLIIEFGGGVRNYDDVKKLIDAGADKIILGSLSVANKPELEKITKSFGTDKFIIASDVLDYKIRTHGWTQDSGIQIFDHIEYCSSLGLNTFLCTDINTDGMLTGPNFGLYKELAERFPEINIIASGGVSSIDDVKMLSRMNLYGVVIGKAIYEGKINLEELQNFAY